MTAAGFSHWLVGSGERKDGGAGKKLIARSFSILKKFFYPLPNLLAILYSSKIMDQKHSF